MKISKETIIRTVLLIAALVNMALNAFGKNTLPFTDDEVSEIISVVFMAVTSIAAWWKNNSFTEKARIADIYLEGLREE